MALAILLYLIALPITLAAEWWLLEKIDSPQISRYLIEHAAVPLLRIWLIWLFILSAYPTLFGWEFAPTLQAIYNAGFQLGDLINALFLIGLLIPLLPMVHRLPSIVVPLQALIACHWLLYWAIRTTGETASIWPDRGMIITFVLISMIGHFVADQLSKRASPRLNNIRTEIYDLILLIVQLPAILIYANDLGSKIKFVAG